MRRHGPKLFLLLALAVLFSGKLFWGGRIPLLRDTFFQLLPFRELARDALLSGEFPLWNPYSNFGQPFLADPESALFYPPSWLFFLLPLRAGYFAFLALHLFAAGAFTYLLLYQWTRSPWASLMGGLAFELNGFILVHLEQLSQLGSLVWTPLALYLLERLLTRRTFGSLFALSLCLALQYLGGYPAMSYYTGVILAVFTLFRTISRGRQEGARAGVKAGLLFPGAVALSLFLALAQVLPNLELLRNSSRAGGVFAAAEVASLPPSHFITWLFPYFFGRPGYGSFWGDTFEFWLMSYYPGFLSLLFAGLALGLGRKKGSPLSGGSGLSLSFFIVLGLLGVLLALGRHTPFFSLARQYLPLFGGFRWPAYGIYLTLFAVVLLSGLGAALWEKRLEGATGGERKGPSPFGETPTWCRFLLFTAGLLLILFLVAFMWPGFLTETLRGFIGSHLKILTPSADIERLIGKFRVDMALSFGFICMGLSIIALSYGRLLKARALKGAALFFLILDLLITFLPLHPSGPARTYEQEPRVIRHLRRIKVPFRVEPLPHETQQLFYGVADGTLFEWAREGLANESSLPYRVFKPTGQAPLTSLRYRELLDFLRREKPPAAARERFAALANIRFSIGSEGLIRVLYDRGSRRLRLLVRKGALPRAFVVGGARAWPERGKILEELFEPDFHPEEEVLIEKKGSHEGERLAAPSRVEHEIKAIRYTLNTVTMELRTSSAGFLFLSDSYYPGWKARIDGELTPIYPANFLFRAIALPAGEHRVVFSYEPRSFRVGVWGSGLSLAASLAFLLYLAFRRKSWS